MKFFILHFLSIFILSVSTASAQTSLTKINSFIFEGDAIIASEKNGFNHVQLDNKQTFSVMKDGKVLGTLVQGRGWLKDMQPVCFIGWSKDGKKIDQFMPTIGQGDWETVGCHKVESVGLISKKDDENARVAVIYTVEASDHYGNDYYVVGFNKSDDIFYDASTTEKFQNSYLKTIADLRKVYQK
jgi:hypothetical protein